MIKFEFTVDDLDAENIFSAIRDSVSRNDEMIIDYMSRNDMNEHEKNSYINWLKANKEYTLGLIEKMKNTRV